MNKNVSLLLVAVLGFIAGFLTAGIAGCVKESKCIDFDDDFDDECSDFDDDEL